MKKIIDRTTYLLASAALLGAVVFAQALPANAANSAMTQSDTAKAQHLAASRVEARIADLHKKLHITAAQTDQWNAFATVMRDNAKTIRQTMVDKRQSAMSMTAVDDLHSYQTLAQAHVDGIAKLVPAFEALYATMSDAQKKAADAVFAQQHGHHDMRSSSN